MSVDQITSLLPITVIVAVSLFILKEAVEYIKNWRAENRQLRAYKILLARECELNHWVLLKLRDALRIVEEDFKNQNPNNHRIERNSSGDIIFKHGDWGSHHLPEVRSNLMSEIMLHVATLSQKLFSALENAYDGLADLRHVRTSLINFNEVASGESKSDFYDGFADYGLREIADVFQTLDKLYQECTGLELKEARIR